MIRRGWTGGASWGPRAEAIKPIRELTRSSSRIPPAEPIAATPPATAFRLGFAVDPAPRSQLPLTAIPDWRLDARGDNRSLVAPAPAPPP